MYVRRGGEGKGGEMGQRKTLTSAKSKMAECTVALFWLWTVSFMDICGDLRWIGLDEGMIWGDRV